MAPKKASSNQTANAMASTSKAINFSDSTSASLARRPRASTSHRIDYSDEKAEGLGGGRSEPGVRKVVTSFEVVDDESGDDEAEEDEDDDDEEEEALSLTVYWKAVQAYEATALKKDQRKIDKAVKEARATFTAASNSAEQSIRAEMERTAQHLGQLAEPRPSGLEQRGAQVAKDWAEMFSTFHTLARQATEEMDQRCKELAKDDVEYIQTMAETVSERNQLDKKAYKRFKQVVISGEQESVEMARMYDEAARVQVKYLKAAARV